MFASDQSQHRYAHVNLVREAPRTFQPGDSFVAKLDAPYLPIAEAQWQARSRYGASSDPDCIWFLDLRFVNPGRDWVPFRFGACRENPDSPWRAYERLDEGGRAPLAPRR